MQLAAALVVVMLLIASAVQAWRQSRRYAEQWGYDEPQASENSSYRNEALRATQVPRGPPRVVMIAGCSSHLMALLMLPALLMELSTMYILHVSVFVSLMLATRYWRSGTMLLSNAPTAQRHVINTVRFAIPLQACLLMATPFCIARIDTHLSPEIIRMAIPVMWLTAPVALLAFAQAYALYKSARLLQALSERGTHSHHSGSEA